MKRHKFPHHIKDLHYQAREHDFGFQQEVTAISARVQPAQRQFDELRKAHKHYLKESTRLLNCLNQLYAAAMRRHPLCDEPYNPGLGRKVIRDAAFVNQKMLESFLQVCAAKNALGLIEPVPAAVLPQRYSTDVRVAFALRMERELRDREAKLDLAQKKFLLTDGDGEWQQ